MQRIKATILATIATAVIGLAASLAPAAALSNSYTTFAASSKSAACSGLSALDGSQACGTKASKNVVGNLTSTVVNIISLILGAAAIIMIIIAGFRFITSNGDSGSVANAKSTLTYALVGLVVAAVAQFMVHYVLKRF